MNSIVDPHGGSLTRALGPRQLFSLGFGAILGAGWIVALGSWLAAAGPLGTAAAFVAGASVIAFISLCYGELGARYPDAGGEVIYAERVFGRRVAFLTGVFLALTYIAVCAFEALSIGWIAMTLWHRLAPSAAPPAHEAGRFEITLALVSLAAIGAINARGVSSVARWQDGCTFALLLCAAVFIVGGCAGGNLDNLSPLVVRNAGRPALSGVLSVFVTAPFWFSGFGVVAQALGENASRGRRRMINTVLISAILASAAFYVLVVLAAAAALPRALLLASPLPAAAAFTASLHSPLLGDLVLLTGLLGLILALNAIYYSASRVLYALGATGALPRVLGRVQAGTGVPLGACACIGILSAAASLLSQRALGRLVDAGSICISAIYVMVCAAAWRVRARGLEAGASRWARCRGLAQPQLALILAVLLVIAGLLTDH